VAASALLCNLWAGAGGRRSSGRGNRFARAADGPAASLRDNGQVNGQTMELRGWWRQPRGRLRGCLALVGSAEQRTDPSGREIGIDIALAAAATIALLITIVYTVKVPVPCTSGGPLGPGGGCLSLAATQGIGWQSALPMTAAAWPLALRRFRPLVTLWLSLAGALVVAGDPKAITWIPVALAVYSATVFSPFRRAAILSVAAAGVLAAATFPGAPHQPAHHMSNVIERGAPLLASVLLLVVGNAMRRWRRRAGDSQAQVLRLRAEHEDATRQAIGKERARIASELHDVVTHNVSMMVVQAGAARRVLGAAPEEARSALLAIEESGRAAITELQHLLGLLALPDEPGDGSLTGSGGTGSLRPQPSLDLLRPLIDRMAAAGLPVRLCVRGPRRALPPGADLAAYRVIQEALTNVIKHAGQPETTVTLDYRPGGLLIEVADAGATGQAEVPAGRRAAPGGPGPVPGTGRGLLGMRERVSLYGGELDAWSRPGGGWLVRARIPQQPQTAAAPDCPALS
jgi:signal transduction histidine kinase